MLTEIITHHTHTFQLCNVLQLVIAPSSSQPSLSGTSFLKKSDLPLLVFRRRLTTHLFDCV